MEPFWGTKESVNDKQEEEVKSRGTCRPLWVYSCEIPLYSENKQKIYKELIYSR